MKRMLFADRNALERSPRFIVISAVRVRDESWSSHIGQQGEPAALLFPFRQKPTSRRDRGPQPESKGLTVSALVGAIECVVATRMQLLIHRLGKNIADPARPRERVGTVIAAREIAPKSRRQKGS